MLKRLLLASTCLVSVAAQAQTGSYKTPTQLNTEINANLASGQHPGITASQHRQVELDLVASAPSVYQAVALGVDCSGATDTAVALQAAINAVPDSSLLYFPTSCNMHLGTTISITNRVGLVLATDINMENTSANPKFTWVGTTNGTMFDIEHSDHVTFRGFHFDVTSGSLNAFLKFDGNPGGGHIGTMPEVAYSDFNASGQSVAGFSAISLSLTATQNWENAYFHDNTIECSGSQTNRAFNGVTTNASTTITSATAAFTAGDVGKRIQLSYPGYYLDTTIASVTNGTTAVLAAANTSSLTNVQLTIGTYFGVGINQGPSQNAKHSRFVANKITNCNVAIQVQGGSADIYHLGGGFGGTGVLYSSPNLNTESMTIAFYENEGDYRGIETHAGNAPFIILNPRIANVNQFADGFFKFGGQTTLIGSGSQSQSPCGNTNANSVIIGENPSVPMILTSIGNKFSCFPGTLVGYSGFSFTNYSSLAYGPPFSINDDIGAGANSTITVTGGKLSMPNLPTADPHVVNQLWNSAGTLKVSGG